MKNNTYIIPGIHFYIVIPKNSDLSLEQFRLEILKSKGQFIPFEQIDGLTIGEMSNALNINIGFAFCAASHIKSTDGNSKLHVLDTLFFPMEYIKKQKDFTIDKVIEKNYEHRYITESNRYRQIFNSFFQKYQDDSYEKTKDRIVKILTKE